MSKLLSTADKKVTIHERIGALDLEDHLTYERFASNPVKFEPRAMAMLEYLRDYRGGPTEVTAFGVCLDQNNPLHVHDLIVPKQKCTMASVDIDTEDLANKVDAYRDAYRKEHSKLLHPYQVNSFWIHTHPGESAAPSSVDKATFRDKNPDLFFVMYILGMTGEETVQMKLNGIDTTIYLPTDTPDEDYTVTEQDQKEWSKIYEDNVQEVKWLAGFSSGFKTTKKKKNKNAPKVTLDDLDIGGLSRNKVRNMVDDARKALTHIMIGGDVFDKQMAALDLSRIASEIEDELTYNFDQYSGTLLEDEGIEYDDDDDDDLSHLREYWGH